MRIAIGCDHTGVEYKEKIKEFLQNYNGGGYKLIDFGTNSPDAVDYPVYADKVCDCVLSGDADRGILICGTGIGMSMAANKHRGIRAAVCGDIKSAELTRQHNDANVLCLGALIIGFVTAREIVRTFLENEFVGGKHKKRIDMFKDVAEKEKAYDGF